MKKLGTHQMEMLQGGICTLPPTQNPNFPFGCLDHCIIALTMSNGNAAFEACPR